MAKATAQQCHALTTYYMQAHEKATGLKPVVNRNKARWGFDSVLMDYTPAQARELIDFYVEHTLSPSIDGFLYNYDRVDSAKQENEKTKARNAQRAKETEARLAEWRKRFGNK